MTSNFKNLCESVQSHEPDPVPCVSAYQLEICYTVSGVPYPLKRPIKCNFSLLDYVYTYSSILAMGGNYIFNSDAVKLIKLLTC